MDRKLDKPAYKPAISPGPPLSHTTPANSANLPAVCLAGPPNPQESDCPESENVRRITYEFISKLCKTNPILSAFYPPSVWRAGGLETPYLAKDYEKNAKFSPAKANPKRTQTNPKQTQFFARQGPPKPKRTQSKPNLSRRSLWRSRIKPAFGGQVRQILIFRPKTRNASKKTCNPKISPLKSRP